VEEWALAEDPAADGEEGTARSGSRAGTEDRCAPRGGRGAYDVATARAVAPLAVLVEYAAPLLRRGGNFIAWKGAPAAAELAAADTASAQLGMEPLDPLPVAPYPGAHALHLYLYSKVGDTPAKFPRRPGMATKRPLGA
jgi:16S rRNA (guanine527-N7)-methyltransferase